MIDTCVSCGEYVPEGRMICVNCEDNAYSRNQGEVAEWIKKKSYNIDFFSFKIKTYFYCSKCGQGDLKFMTKFCPNCGRKMKNYNTNKISFNQHSAVLGVPDYSKSYGVEH